MKNRYKKISKEAIPYQHTYQGYLWYSDAKEPEVIDNVPFTPDMLTPMPFVVEGNLYSKDAGISIQIRNVDGDYHIAQIDLSNLEIGTFNKQTYIGHRTSDFPKYAMIEAWEKVQDEQLDGLTTLEPIWSAFYGFQKSQL